MRASDSTRNFATCLNKNEFFQVSASLKQFWLLFEVERGKKLSTVKSAAFADIKFLRRRSHFSENLSL